jgi:UDP-N-acetylmuramoyl-L-alanyl-D-glutamate--2,6-diaminopimelate ligase
MVEVGCDYCFMEVSSHSIVQRRIGGLHFAGALFSNITHDHLDYHKTFAEYIRAKKLFFDELPREAFALVNVDDRNGEVMVQNTRAKVCRLSLRSMADFVGRVIEMHLDGMLLRVDGRELWVRFLGRFNAYNLLTVYGAAVLLGADREEVLRVLSMLESVNGRFEALRSEDGVTAIVDYAHTPDALQNVIDTINDIRGAGRLTVVVGCGGNRDKTKRPEMAQIAVRGGDRAILTSDNPRGEDPNAILDDMVAGLEPTDRYLRIVDRREAIRTAVMLAEAGDVILIAGKGHETYQEVEGVKHHFDDREQVREAFDTLRTKR